MASDSFNSLCFSSKLRMGVRHLCKGSLNYLRFHEMETVAEIQNAADFGRCKCKLTDLLQV